MLDIKFVRENPDVVRQNIRNKFQDAKLPLVIWLHGAGEGGTDPRIAYTGNKVVNMSSPELQKKLGLEFSDGFVYWLF